MKFCYFIQLLALLVAPFNIIFNLYLPFLISFMYIDQMPLPTELLAKRPLIQTIAEDLISQREL